MKKNFLTTLIIIASIASFFTIAFSEIETLTKAVILLLLLGITGWLIHKIAGIEGYYGLLVLKGEHGFNLMADIAKKQPKLVRELADFGLTFGFGLPYGYALFKKSKKFLLHALISSVFFLFPLLGAPNPAFNQYLLVASGLLFGLFGVTAYTLVQNAFNILTIPGSPAGVSVLIPGVTVPYEAIIAIIIIAIVHELAHGVLAHVEKIKIKSSGALLYGFLPIGAFVEPDEEEFKKTEIHKKRRILIAGSTSNFMFFLLFLGLSVIAGLAVSSTIQGVSIANSTIATITPGLIVQSLDGESFHSFSEYRNKLVQEAQNDNLITIKTNEGETEIPATLLAVGKTLDFSINKGVLTEGEKIHSIDGKQVNSITDLKTIIDSKQPNDSLDLQTENGKKTVFLDDKKRIGATFQQVPSIEFKDVPTNEFLYSMLTILASIITWTFLLNFILASVNLLPIFVTDGHQIVRDELQNKYGEKGKKIALAISILFLLTILINALPALNISFPWFS
ncbi:site-2 protease family protein [Candidatus Micrarchaeota archaeon]|nr:site-2 protease family protein [Candidatus Micrarchaeota archaeon]